MLIQIHFFSLGMSHVPNKVHACGVCSHTGRLILRGIVSPRSVLDAWDCSFPLPSSLFGHDNPIYRCPLNSSGVPGSPVFAGAYSIISNPNKIANKNLFCMYSQTCPRRAPKEQAILPAVRALAKIKFKFL